MKYADGYMCYYDKIDMIQHLNHTDYGMVRRAVDRYAAYGEIPSNKDLPDDLMPFFIIWKPNIDAGKIKYAEECVKKTYAVSVGRYKKDDPNKPELWRWYAEYDGYDPALFKKQPWYDLAASEHKRIHENTNATITNTIVSQSNQNNNQYHGHDIERAPAGVAAVELMYTIAEQLSKIDIGTIIEENNFNMLGKIAKQYGLSVTCIDRFMRERIPNDQRDQAFVLAEYIVKNGGRLPVEA